MYTYYCIAFYYLAYYKARIQTYIWLCCLQQTSHGFHVINSFVGSFVPHKTIIWIENSNDIYVGNAAAYILIVR